MTTPFLRDQWYVAAMSAEVTDAPLGRTICNEPIVLFRPSSGGIAALEDRCPHRKAPLSLGRMCDGHIECAYHGIQFDGGGVCRLIPSQHAIPRGLTARSYPVVDRRGRQGRSGAAAGLEPAQLAGVDDGLRLSLRQGELSA